MNYNYHTHTWRCHHATASEEEYIQKAIDGGIKHMGFSDHVPFVFPDGFQSGYRVPMEQAEEYIAVLSQLRKKYKNKIDIKIGFEMEYYPKYFDDMLKKVIELGGEYLILGQHFVDNEHPGGVYTYKETEDKEILKKYVLEVIEGIHKGVFTYIAHPDLINFVGDSLIYTEEMRKICVESRKTNTPLEINFLGIRGQRAYPNENFWKIAGEEKSPVTFGFDAHDTESAFDEKSLIKAKEIVNKYNLNYIGEPKLIKPLYA